MVISAVFAVGLGVAWRLGLPATRASWDGWCLAYSPEEFRRFLREEYGGHDDSSPWNNAFDLRSALKVEEGETTTAPLYVQDDCLCRCDAQLVVVDVTIGTEARGFTWATGELAWDAKVTDSPAYCGGRAGGLRFGTIPDRRTCSCVPVDQEIVADPALAALTPPGRQGALWARLAHDRQEDRCRWARPRSDWERLKIALR